MALLPLFPLNVVLFPGMRLKLHIFEERYKLMINQCIDADEAFGVVLIKVGREALGPMAVPHSVGCEAQIQEVQRLPLGRMNISVIGIKPFRIKRIERSKPYLIGEVEYFSLSESQPELTQRYSAMLRPLVIRYLDTLSSSGVANYDAKQIPQRPQAIAMVALLLLQADNAQKQRLLATPSLSRVLHALVEIYRLETLLLPVRLSPPGKDFDIGPFSSN